MRFSVCDMKSTITGWPLAAAHGNLTPAHTDECAAQCFEGVQRGSIIIRMKVVAKCGATCICKLAVSLTQSFLSVWIMARHLPGCASFGFVIRLPMNFSRCSISALSGACDIWLWISRERLPSGDKNLSSRMHE